MKKYLYLLGAVSAALFSSSCKKDFTCTCTSTNSLSTAASINETTIKDVSKKAAKANCVSTEWQSTYQQSTYTYGYGTTYTTITVTNASECELD